MCLHQFIKHSTLIGRQGIALGGFYLVGVNGFAVDADFIVHMRTGGLTGPAHSGNSLPLFDIGAFFYQQAAAVAVVSPVTVWMTDDHHFTVAASPAGKLHGTASGGKDGRTVGSTVVNAGMALVFFRDGVEASY